MSTRSIASASSRLVGRLRRAARRRPRPRGSSPRAPRRPARRRSSPRAPGSRSLRRSTGTRAPRRASSSARRPASSTRPGEHDARRGVAAASRAIAASTSGRAGPSRPGDHEAQVGMRRRERAERARRGAARFLRGSSVPIASTNGAPPTRSSTSSAASRASVAERRDAERDHDEPARARSPGPKISSISPATNSEPVCTVAPRRDRAPHDRHERAHLGRAQLGIADERAVVDADERREPARRREVVRRVDDRGRPQPAVDARHVAARPRRQQHARRASGRSACRAARRSRWCARAQAERVRNERRARRRARCSASTISATASPIPVRSAEQRRDVDRDRSGACSRSRVRITRESHLKRPRRRARRGRPSRTSRVARAVAVGPELGRASPQMVARAAPPSRHRDSSRRACRPRARARRSSTSSRVQSAVSTSSASADRVEVDVERRGHDHDLVALRAMPRDDVACISAMIGSPAPARVAVRVADCAARSSTATPASNASSSALLACASRPPRPSTTRVARRDTAASREQRPRPATRPREERQRASRGASSVPSKSNAATVRRYRTRRRRSSPDARSRQMFRRRNTGRGRWRSPDITKRSAAPAPTTVVLPRSRPRAIAVAHGFGRRRRAAPASMPSVIFVCTKPGPHDHDAARRCRRGCRRGPGRTRRARPSTSRRRSSTAGPARRRPTTAARACRGPAARSRCDERDRDRHRRRCSSSRTISSAAGARRPRRGAWSPSTPNATSTRSKSPNAVERRRRRTARASRSRSRRTRRCRPSARPRPRISAAAASSASGSRAASTTRAARAGDQLRARRARDVGAAAEHEHRLHRSERVLHRAWLLLRSTPVEAEAAVHVAAQHVRRDRAGARTSRQPVELRVHRREQLGRRAASPWRGTRGRRPRRRARRGRRAARRASRAGRRDVERERPARASGSRAAPRLSCSNRLSTARNDAQRCRAEPLERRAHDGFRAVRHDELVLHEAARAVDAVPVAHAVERVEERGDRSGSWPRRSRGALRNHSSLNARIDSGLSSPFGTHGGAREQRARRELRARRRAGFGGSSSSVAWSPRVSTERPRCAPRARQSIHATE